jgi:vancomycin resistance protein VanW
MRKIFPFWLRLRIKLGLRKWKDFFNGRRFAKSFCATNRMIECISITQKVNITSATTNKLHNLSIATGQINQLEILPGEMFSFWHCIQNPSEENGYKKSRSIKAAHITQESGGGLCQLSGLVYFLCLQAGMKIAERHAHSRDIYTEAERFTPLGSDATVVYGYKDLRILNNLKHPVVLQFSLDASNLTGKLFSRVQLPLHDISFTYSEQTGFVEASTVMDGRVIAKDRYVREV